MENTIQIIPNPANESAQILLSKNDKGMCKLKLKDITGREMFDSQFNGSEMSYTLDLRLFLQGMYFVEIQINGNSVTTSKLEIII